MVFTWKGREIATTGDVVIAMEQLESPEEARAFKSTFIQSERSLVPNPVELVNHNLGYLTGYMEEETRTRLMEWLDVVHPIFGRTTPAPDEAFQAGVSAANDPRNDSNWNDLDEETKTDLMQDHAEHLETVTLHWSTEHGRCYECGLPAAFYLPYAYGDWNDLDEEDPQPTTVNKRCAICAANAAAIDDEVVRRIDVTVIPFSED